MLYGLEDERWNEENNKKIEKAIEVYKGTEISQELKFLYESGCSYRVISDFFDTNSIENTLEMA